MRRDFQIYLTDFAAMEIQLIVAPEIFIVCLVINLSLARDGRPVSALNQFQFATTDSGHSPKILSALSRRARSV
jgi:hypothetical protein